MLQVLQYEFHLFNTMLLRDLETENTALIGAGSREVFLVHIIRSLDKMGSDMRGSTAMTIIFAITILVGMTLCTPPPPPQMNKLRPPSPPPPPPPPPQ